MKIRTAENLVDALARELAWRKKELAALRGFIEKARTTRKLDVLVRSGITLLYAHWEGFVRCAASAYLEFVAMQRLRYEQLTPNFIALGARSKLAEARQTRKASIHNQLVEFFLYGLSERCQIPYEDAVDTRSNLSSEVFKEVMAMLNLDYLPYATKEKLLDERLLRLRNTIAHGQYLSVGIDEYLELHTEIITLMDLLRTQIENAVVVKTFRR